MLRKLKNKVVLSFLCVVVSLGSLVPLKANSQHEMTASNRLMILQKRSERLEQARMLLVGNAIQWLKELWNPKGVLCILALAGGLYVLNKKVENAMVGEYKPVCTALQSEAQEYEALCKHSFEQNVEKKKLFGLLKSKEGMRKEFDTRIKDLRKLADEIRKYDNETIASKVFEANRKAEAARNDNTAEFQKKFKELNKKKDKYYKKLLKKSHVVDAKFRTTQTTTSEFDKHYMRLCGSLASFVILLQEFARLIPEGVVSNHDLERLRELYRYFADIPRYPSLAFNLREARLRSVEPEDSEE